MKVIRTVPRLGVLLFACVIPSAAQLAGAPLLKGSDLQADVSVLRQAYEALHPGLYRYSGKPEMDAAFEALGRQVDHDESLRDAFLAFSEFAARVRCGHTQANPFNQSKEVIGSLFQSSTRVPFYFLWLDRRMIVTQDFTADGSLPRGTEVASIDGVPVQVILAKLMTVARADGANDRKRIAQLAVTGESSYETFDLYYPMFFPSTSTQMKFAVRLPGMRRLTHVLATPLSFEQRIAPIKEREAQRKGGSDVLFASKTLAGGAISIRMPTWALYDSQWDWKQWLKKTVEAAIKSQAPALILDIRGNEGGQDVGNEILPYLIDAPVTLSPMRRLVRYRKVPDELLPYLDTWDKSFRDWGASAVELPMPWPTAPAEVPYLKLTRYDDDSSGDVIQPAALRFHGQVIVLTDATNSSATFQFAQNIQLHHLGLLVGQPTGGSQRGINGGAFFFLRLPHSGIELDLPLIGTFPPQPLPDAGVTPDVPVRLTAADLARGRDTVMAAALAQTHRH